MIIKWAIFILNQDTLKTYAKKEREKISKKAPKACQKTIWYKTGFK
jgi:hypothetical protein